MARSTGIQESASNLEIYKDKGSLGVRVDTATGVIYENINGQTVRSTSLTGGTFNKVHTAFSGSGERRITVALATTGATATNILVIPVPASGAVGVFAKIIGKKVGANADGLVANIYNAATNNAGTVAVVGTTGGSVVENSTGAPAVTIEASSTNVVVNVAGVASEDWVWTGVVEWNQVSIAA